MEKAKTQKKVRSATEGMPVTIVVHSGEFHTDDVFAVATLLLVLEKTGERHRKVDIVRSRDEETIKRADYVADVGGIYDAGQNRFDHHQIGGAGERANKIPYASFGLVWKKFGEQISGSRAVADFIDGRIVQPIDAVDSGVAIFKEIIPEVRPYDVSSIIRGMNPNWNEEPKEADKNFLNAVELVKNILWREIQSAKSDLDGQEFAIEAYEKSADKRLIILDKRYPWEKAFSKFPEPLFVVFPKEVGWWVKTVRSNLNAFENRKDLPVTWRGKRGDELSAATGVPGGIFCHNMLFTAGAETREAAIAMAKIALAA